MGRRGTAHRLTRWLWTSRRLDARLARLLLLPLSALYRLAMEARAVAYARGVVPVHRLPLPTVAVGNLTVGGSGKTPLAGWIANYYAGIGVVPGILLRGYRGGDEAEVHRQAVPGARVVANPDRVLGAARAVAEGAQVLVLDDAYQRLDVARDLNIAVVAAETIRAVHWSLPAGPWREGLSALARADALVVTRKRADAETARALATELGRRIAGPVAVVHLAVTRYQGMLTGQEVPAAALDRQRVVVATAIGDPEAFIAQTKATGAAVQVATWRDHHVFSDEDLAWLAKAARKADRVVITSKDAVKLRDRWPASVPEPLVAVLDLEWEEGMEALVRVLHAVARPFEQT